MEKGTQFQLVDFKLCLYTYTLFGGLYEMESKYEKTLNITTKMFSW